MNKYTLIYICIEQSCVAFYILNAVYFFIHLLIYEMYGIMIKKYKGLLKFKN